MQSNGIKSALLGLLCVLLFASCTSTTYVENYEKNPDSYEVTTLVWKNPIFGKKCNTWNDYRFDRAKGYGSKTEILALSTEKAGAIYDFSKGDTALYRVSIIYYENGVEVPSLLHDKVMLARSTVVFTTGNPAVNIPLLDDDFIAQDSSVIPNLTIEKIRESLQNGKVYKMWGNVSTGVRLSVGGEEYAVVDFYSKTPRVLRNKNFSLQLNEQEEDFLASVVMGMYAYYQLLEQNGSTAGDTIYVEN